MKKSQDVPAVLNLYVENDDKLDAMHLSNIFGALANSVKGSRDVARLETDERFKSLLETVIGKLNTMPEWFGVRQLANMCHSFGKMKLSDRRFFDLITGMRDTIAKNGEPQHLANIAWAFATAGYKSDTLFTALAGEHARLVVSGDVQHMR